MDSEHLHELKARVAARDVEALGLYAEHIRPELRAFIGRRVGAALRSKVEPEDLVQEVVARAIQALPSYELGTRDPFGWLCDLAERRIVDAHRRHFGAQKRDAAREQQGHSDDPARAGLLNLLIASMTTPSAVFSRNARAHLLVDAMARLSEEQRTALRMRYGQGLPTKEIATHLGKSDGSVRVMLTRALDKLGELLPPDAAPR